MSYPYTIGLIYDRQRLPFVIADDVGKLWYQDVGDNCHPLREKCRSLIRPGMVVVDCGAHQGLMTVLFAKWTGPSGSVIAFDALPSNADVICENVKLNNLSNVAVHGCAVGDRSEKHAVSSGNSNVILNSDAHFVADGDLVVSVVSLDDALGSKRVDFIKIDVEGHEVAALKGARRILSLRPIIDLELHTFLFKDRVQHVAAVVDLLPSARYLYSIDESNDWVPKSDLDIHQLASLDNPHIFAKPTGRYITKIIGLFRSFS